MTRGDFLDAGCEYNSLLMKVNGKTYDSAVVMQMSRKPAAFSALVCAAMIVALSPHASSQQRAAYPKPTDLPNPYRLVEHWPTLPSSMNGGRWGEVIRVHVDAKGNVWVFHRCFNVVPAGSATCVGRGAANPSTRGRSSGRADLQIP